MIKYVGQLVVLRSKWNLYSHRLGVVISQEDFNESAESTLIVMWSDIDGVKIKKHLQDALIPVTEETIKKIKERICVIK